MAVQITTRLGILQAGKFIPELLKACESKQVVIESREFKRINFLQGELIVTLSGTNLAHILGFIEGYGIAVRLNKSEPKKVAPAK